MRSCVVLHIPIKNSPIYRQRHYYSLKQLVKTIDISAAYSRRKIPTRSPPTGHRPSPFPGHVRAAVNGYTLSYFKQKTRRLQSRKWQAPSFTTWLVLDNRNSQRTTTFQPFPPMINGRDAEESSAWSVKLDKGERGGGTSCDARA